MTIRIIRDGKLPEDKDYAGTCNYCGTAIECKQRDGTIKYGGQRDGNWLDVECPKCKRTMHAYEKNTGYSGQYWDR